jgi:hypothetical protein
VLALALGSRTASGEDASGLAAFLSDVWQIEDGLPHNAVQAIVQSRDGYLWMGTPGGLARFDGARFTLFNQGELRHNNVHALLADRDGSLWIGTYGGGLYRYDGSRFEAFGPGEGLGSTLIRTLYRDRRGRLWVGTHGAGVSFRERGRFQTLRAAEGLSNDTVRVVYEDREGRIWIGTNAAGRTGDREGISIYTATDRTGYILVSDQEVGKFHIFPREGSPGEPHVHRRLKVVQTKTDDSDGSDVTSAALGDAFPKGLFVAMSQDGTFQLYSWADLAGDDLTVAPASVPIARAR